MNHGIQTAIQTLILILIVTFATSTAFVIDPPSDMPTWSALDKKAETTRKAAATQPAEPDETETVFRSWFSKNLGRSIGYKALQVLQPDATVNGVEQRNQDARSIPASLRTGAFSSIDAEDGEVCLRSLRRSVAKTKRGDHVLQARISTTLCRATNPQGGQAVAVFELKPDMPELDREAFREGVRYSRPVRQTVRQDNDVHYLTGMKRSNLTIEALTVDGRQVKVAVTTTYDKTETEQYRAVRLREDIERRIKPGVRAHYRAAYDWLSANKRYNFSQLPDDIQPDCSDCRWSPDHYSVTPASAIADRWSDQALAIEIHDLPSSVLDIEQPFQFETLSLDHAQYLPNYRGGTYRLVFDTIGA